MQISGWLSVFLVGAFGGAMIEAIKWWRHRERGTLPEYIRSFFYWAVTLTMIVGGGLLAVLYGIDEPRNALMVMNVGASAPALISALATPDAVKADRRITRSTHVVAQAPSIGLRNFLSFGG
jgi:hypothetical protein